MKQIREVLRARMDPETTAMRRVCAVCAQALGLIAGRATAQAGSGEANDVRLAIAELIGARLAEPEPGKSAAYAAGMSLMRALTPDEPAAPVPIASEPAIDAD